MTELEAKMKGVLHSYQLINKEFELFQEQSSIVVGQLDTLSDYEIGTMETYQRCLDKLEDLMVGLQAAVNGAFI